MTHSGLTNLVLVGFMGAGKSTVARICARRLGMTLCDTDHILEARFQASITQVFAQLGEKEFRRQESNLVQELSTGSRQVIATGGGVVMNPINVAALRATGLVILLNADTDTIVERVRHQTHRPLLMGVTDLPTHIDSLLAQRTPAYREAAHCTVEIRGLTAAESAANVINLFKTISGEGK